MNLMDYILLGIIILAVIAAIIYMRKHKGGCGDCKGCDAKCHQPKLYEAYRKDHPQEKEKR